MATAAIEKTLTDSDFTGCCPTCRLQLNGRVHVCPGGPMPKVSQEIMGAQFVDEMEVPTYRPYGVRLEEGFDMLVDSGWDTQD